MAAGQRVGDLEVAQDLTFQRREWTIQRVGWVAMAALLVVGLLGLFGSGPLSDAATENGSLQLDYGRFERKRKPTQLRVEVAAGTAQDGRIRLWLDERYLERIELQNISPEPEESLAGSDRTVYVFLVSDAGQPAKVSFEIEPVTFGRFTGRLGIVDGPMVEFSQVVYP